MIEKEIRKFLDDFRKRYKIKENIFEKDIRIEEKETGIDVFVYVSPEYKIEYDIISIIDLVILLQKLIVNPVMKLKDKNVNLYFLVGNLKKKANMEDVPVDFKVEVVNSSLDRLLKPVMDSGLPEIMLGWWVAKTLVQDINDVLKTKENVGGGQEGIYVY